jgi:hypothetical protein
LRPMAYVIKIEWLGGSDGPHEHSRHTGRYVRRYDPDAHNGLGEVWTAAEPVDALQFATGVAAAEFYRQASKVKPVRGDGRPNRPLTAFTVSVYDWEKVSGER